jgi:predicted TIM-barrel fold metal-dependent hydrolase
MPSFTRRNVLAGLALAAQGSSKDQGSNYIDAHVHVWTPDVASFPRQTHAGGPTYKPDSFTPEQLLAIARPSGVSRIVLVQMSFYGTDNSYLLDAIKRYPDTFVGVGILDHRAPGVRNEMIRLQPLKVHGYRITPGSDTAGWLDAPGMQAMWQYGAEKRVAMCPLIGPDAIASVDRMCGKFPDTPVVIDHMARIGAGGVVRETDIRALCGLAHHKNTHVKVSAFYALGKKQYPYTDLIPLIRALYDAYGPQRLMWASDSPFQVQEPHTYAGSIELVRDRLDFLSDEDHEWLLRKSAEKVFFTPL